MKRLFSSIRKFSSSPLERIKESARTQHIKLIILPEGNDVRVLKAARKSVDQKIARISVIGSPLEINKIADDHGISLEDVEIQEANEDNERFETVCSKFHELRAKKGISLDQARNICKDPQIFANMLVRVGLADGTVSGAVATSGKTAQAAVWCLGLAPGIECASSFFLMHFPLLNKSFIYADCGFVIDPTPSQLACIAITSAESCRKFLLQEPRVALLSFSTYQSAKHPNVDKVREALSLIRDRSPNLLVDGDLQVDAALIPEVQQKKAPGSPIEGDANVFIFPDLQSGNIAYKISERLAGATAIGPIFQGLGYPANDVSRGCSDDDLVGAVAMTCIQAAII